MNFALRLRKPESMMPGVGVGRHFHQGVFIEQGLMVMRFEGGLRRYRVETEGTVRKPTVRKHVRLGV